MHHTHDTVQLSYTLNEITHMLTFEKRHTISMNAIIAANSGTCTKPSFIKDMFSSAHFRAEAHELWHNMFRAESERIEFQRQTKHSAMLKAQADNDAVEAATAAQEEVKTKFKCGSTLQWKYKGDHAWTTYSGTYNKKFVWYKKFDYRIFQSRKEDYEYYAAEAAEKLAFEAELELQRIRTCFNNGDTIQWKSKRSAHWSTVPKNSFVDWDGKLYNFRVKSVVAPANDPLTLIAALDQRITDLEVPPKQATKYYVGNAQTNVYEMVDNKSIAECCLCIEAFDTMWPVDSTQRTRWFIGFTGIDGKEQLVSVSTLTEAKKAANDNTRPGYMWPKIRIVCFREST